MSELPATTGTGSDLPSETPASQPSLQPASAPGPGVFGTKLPSTIVLGMAVLLFFMPFLDIRCNNMSLKQVSGVNLATGFRVNEGSNRTVFGKLEQLNTEEELKQARSSDPYALAALILAVAACVLAIIDKPGTRIMGAVGASMSVVALILLMIKIKNEIGPELTGSPGEDLAGFGGRNPVIAVNFTPQFYLAIICLAVGAWLCFRRYRST